MRRVLDWIPVALGVALLTTLVSLQWSRIVRGQNDFAALYAGAKLAGTQDLYSRAANQQVIAEVTGVMMESVVYTRPPFYASLLKPLAWLPYLAADSIFWIACLGSLLWFVWRFSKECKALPLFASFSIPVAAVLPQGQDTPLLLAFVGLSILLLRQKRDFLAGVIFSLCAIKFHLFLFVPLLLLLKKRWGMVAGGAAGTLALTLWGCIVAGPQAMVEYVATLRDPWINFSADMMPNIHGFASSLHAGTSLEAALTVAVVALFGWTCRAAGDFEFLFGLSLICGLLTSYHSGVGDQILLLPAFVLIVSSTADKLVRLTLAGIVTPIPYFIGLSPSLVLPSLLLVVVAFAALTAGTVRKPEMVPAADLDVPTPAANA